MRAGQNDGAMSNSPSSFAQHQVAAALRPAGNHSLRSLLEAPAKIFMET